MIGVYSIRNRITGDEYIGASKHIEQRWNEHAMKRMNYHPKLYKAIEKYGIKNFDFEVVEECPEELLNERELHFIHTRKPKYNTIGLQRSEETRKRVSEGTRKWWQGLDEETKEKIIKHNLKRPQPGHPVSADTRAKISRKVSEVQKQKVRCIETGEIFDSVHDCDMALAYRGACTAYWAGKIKSVKGFHVEKV